MAESGTAPVYVGEIYTALATCPAGVKPRPTAPGSPRMTGIPVVVQAWPTGGKECVKLDVLSWVLCPHVGRRVDKDTGEVRSEIEGALAFIVGIPEGYELRKIPDPVPELLTPAAEEVTGVDWTPNPNPGVITEFASVDPGIFSSDPERHSTNMRALNNKKLAPPLGDN